MVRRRILPFRIPFFRIFYSTTYTSLFIVVLVLLAITPASLIYFAIAAHAYQYIFMVGGVYVLTAILVLFIYSSRLYTNRSVLAAVGKSWIPVEDGEIGKNVRKMIVKALERSALIALESRPRDLSKEAIQKDERIAREKDILMEDNKDDDDTVGTVIPVDPLSPPWGHVEHAGWSSPSQIDTEIAPHVYYDTVIQELPDLIEAQAVSLAANSSTSPGLLAAIPRAPNVSLRDYLSELDSLDVVLLPDVTENFLDHFEHARYSGKALNQTQFRELMTAFADLLAGMELVMQTPELLPVSKGSEEDDTRSLGPSMTSSSSDASRRRPTTGKSHLAVVHTPLDHHTPNADSPAIFSTPLTGRQPSPEMRHQPSMGSVIRNVQFNPSTRSSSTSSLRSAQSVIRLNPSPRPGQLPYEWAKNEGP